MNLTGGTVRDGRLDRIRTNDAVTGGNSMQAQERTDRLVGRVISLGGLVIIAGRTPLAIAQIPDFAVWWSVAGLSLVVLVVVMALFGGVLPMRALRIMWTVIPAVLLVLQLWTFGAFTGTDPDLRPWVWSLEPLAVSYLVLVVPVRAAVVAGVAFGTTVALSAWLFLGFVPDVVAASTPLHMGNVAFTAIFLAIRRRLGVLRSAEEQARIRSEERAREAAAAEHQEELARLVHDEVLSVLTAATLFHGPAPAVLRDEAREALVVLNRPGDRLRPPDEPVPVQTAVAEAESVVRRVHPTARVCATAQGPGSVPGRVLDAMLLAVAESLRNVLRHAGGGASATVEIQAGDRTLTIRIRDDGPGFDPTTISAERVGLRSSIQGRMARIRGSAQIRSSPTDGTEVTLRWKG